MPYFSLSLSVPPEDGPITLEEALTQCHAEAGVEDDWFMARIRAGVELVENFVKQSLMPQTRVLRVEGFMPEVIEIRRSPLIKLLDMRYQTSPRHEWYGIELDKVVTIKEGLPSRVLVPNEYIGKNGILRIEYQAGYADTKLIPSELKDAILLYVSHNYENRSGERELPEAFYNLIERHRIYL